MANHQCFSPSRRGLCILGWYATLEDQRTCTNRECREHPCFCNWSLVVARSFIPLFIRVLLLSRVVKTHTSHHFWPPQATNAGFPNSHCWKSDRKSGQETTPPCPKKPSAGFLFFWWHPEVFQWHDLQIQWGVSKNSFFFYPQMDGLFHGKPYEQMGWFGGKILKIPIFLVQHPYASEEVRWKCTRFLGSRGLKHQYDIKKYEKVPVY